MGSLPEAFAPAAISNFFAIHDQGTFGTSDFKQVGATGGGYMLSRGVRSEAKLLEGPAGVQITVNGDPHYEARTTAKAIELMLKAVDEREKHIGVIQTMEVPIGYGFGASAASALSGVKAVARLLELDLKPEQVAYHAHAADIICRTGLGTVSVIYRYGGAGIITKPGAPGVAKVHEVLVPADVRIVTASLSPYHKTVLLSSPGMKQKVNRLGHEALERASDLTLESLVRAGEVFSESLGLESIELGRLARVAREKGAIGASQNMVGNALHAVVMENEVQGVARALQADFSSPDVDVFEFWRPDL